VKNKRPSDIARKQRDQEHKDLRDAAVRKVAGDLELYWDLCRSWCASGDDELRKRMMNVRADALSALMCVMPVMCGDGFDTAEDRVPGSSVSRAKH
jgi:hypothetical protein